MSESVIEVRYRQQHCEMQSDGESLTLGRDATSDLVVSEPSVSRAHAKIVYRMGEYILVDHSKHGSTLITENGEACLLHGEEIVLHNSGRIVLGTIDPEDVKLHIQYEVAIC